MRKKAIGRLAIMSALALAALASIEASAHVGPGAGDGLRSGFAHPFSGLDHLVAMVALGLWGAQLGMRALWLLPVIFPLIMACGGFLGLIGVTMPGTEIAIALSGVGLGAAVMTELRPPLWGAALVVGVFGLFHGYAHGTELPPGDNALLFSIGFVLATGLLHASGIVLGSVHRWGWGRFALRAVGAVILCSGAFFLRSALG